MSPALFIAAPRSRPDGAPVVNVGGHVVEVGHFVDRVREITGFAGVGSGTEPLPLPHGASPDGLSDLLGDIALTPLDDAITETASFFSEAFTGNQL